MEFFKHKTHIDFMELRRFTAILSLVFFIASMLSLFIKGLNFGLDFKGGTQIHLAYEQSADMNEIRSALNRADLVSAVVQSYGSSKEVLISIAPRAHVSAVQLQQKIIQVLPSAQIKGIEFVGPHVGKEMAEKGFLAILVALLGTMIYIATRFEWRFAVGAAIALIHDPVIILGLFSFFQWEFNLTVLAAVLAVIGYSLNDTIVIFDRIRENFRKLRKETPMEVANLSINQTLSRTVMTSAMTLVVVAALFIYGGNMIHGFSIALMIGIIVGTYSSIYIAGASAIALGLSKNDLITAARQTADDRP